MLDDGRPFLIMEWLVAPVLARWLEACAAPPPFRDVLAIGRALVATLEALVAAGMLHHDLKPENLTLASSPPEPGDDVSVFSFRVCDFGSARARPSALPEARAAASGSAAIGTADYMAPERVLGAPGDERSEVYSLGVLLFELSTLRLPFVSGGRSTLHEHVNVAAPAASRFAELPRVWDELLQDCLAKDPARRPATVAELARRLRGLAESSPRSDAARLTAPSSLSSSAQQPVAILALSGVERALECSELVADYRGIVARMTAERALAVFTALDCEPLAAAVSAALALAAAGLVSGVGLHVALASVARCADGAPSVHSPAIDQPQSWWTNAGQSALFISPDALAGCEPERVEALRRALGRREGSALAPRVQLNAASPPLFGREAVERALQQSLERWQRSGNMAVFQLLGSPASGKTRMAAEAARLARAAGNVEVLELGAGTKHALELPTQHGPLALILDDAQLVEDRVLDELERRLLSQSDAPIWLFCCVDARFVALRGTWGQRIRDFTRCEIAALERDAALSLARHWLAPAEYVPDEALNALCAAAADLPGVLRQLTLEVHRAGLVRERPDGRSYFFDAARFGSSLVARLWHWMAARELERLEPALAAGAKLAAVLAPDLERELLEHVQRSLLAAKWPLEIVEASVLLERLFACGVLCPGPGGRLQFRAPALAEAIATLISEEARQHIHGLALDYYESRSVVDGAAFAAVARHAQALSDHRRASAALGELGQRAARAQRIVDAEAHFSAALGFCSEPSQRVPWLLGRGRARCRLYRLAEARDDLEACAALASSSGEHSSAAHAGFELATVLDWAGDYRAAAAAAEAAEQHASRVTDRALEARALVARGRTAWRNGDVPRAVNLLDAAVRACEQETELESAIIAGLLLGCALVQSERRAEAAACFARVLAAAEAFGDGLHLCAALGNRAFLWAVESDVERCLQDLGRAVTVARRLGHPGTERTALLNLAEVLYWAGREDEALPLLEQARVLEDRFLPRPPHSAVLLLARIALLQRRYESARDALVWLAERQLPEDSASNARALYSALLHALRARGVDVPSSSARLEWREIRELSAGFLPDERLELSYWELFERWLRRANGAKEAPVSPPAQLAAHPVWRARVAALANAPQAASTS